MRLIPRFAMIGPWYVALPYRLLAALALFAALLWPYALAAFVVGTHARHLTGWTIFAAGYSLVSAVVLFVAGSRRERRDRDLLARLDAVQVG